MSDTDFEVGFYQYQVSGIYHYAEDGIWRDVTADYRRTNFPRTLPREKLSLLVKKDEPLSWMEKYPEFANWLSHSDNPDGENPYEED